jgi:heme oxygenase
MLPHRRNLYSATSARASLQMATKAAHLRLHEHPELAALAAGRMNRDAYRNLLGRLYGFHFPLETRLLEAPWHGLFDVRMQERLRTHFLRQDLLDLGLNSENISALPLADNLPVLDSPGKFLGCLYVREGSTLGARQLAKGLDSMLGSTEARGRQFLAGGAGCPELFHSCCEAIEAASGMGLLLDLIVGAEQTFHAMESWLGHDLGDAAK